MSLILALPFFLDDASSYSSISMFYADTSSQQFLNSRMSELLTVVNSTYCRSKHMLIGQESVDGGNRARAQNWMPQTDVGEKDTAECTTATPQRCTPGTHMHAHERLCIIYT